MAAPGMTNRARESPTFRFHEGRHSSLEIQLHCNRHQLCTDGESFETILCVCVLFIFGVLFIRSAVCRLSHLLPV